MRTLLKNLQNYLIVFFALMSVTVIVIGINRAKKTHGENIASTTPTDKKPEPKVSGSFTGNPYKTQWGNAIAKIEVKGGRIVGVTMPSVPNSPPSLYAQPYLIDQALKTGGANIQGVSGATYTSNAFKLSLESAIGKAGVNNTSTSVSENTARADLPKTATTPTSLPVSSNGSTAPVTSSATGSFTGNTYQTPFGNVVAAVEVKGGKVVAVTMPSVPNSPPSIYAQPYLVDQALKAGGANIQGVSGATYTSIAFKSSLESALAKAGVQNTTSGSASQNVKSPSPSVPRSYRGDDDWGWGDDD